MTSLEQRTDALLARHRSRRTVPTRQEIDDLYTDGCAEVLAIDVRYRRVERRLEAVQLDAVLDSAAARHVASLSAERDELIRRRSELRAELRQLRAAVEWRREEAARELSCGWPMSHALGYRRSD